PRRYENAADEERAGQKLENDIAICVRARISSNFRPFLHLSRPRLPNRPEEDACLLERRLWKRFKRRAIYSAIASIRSDLGILVHVSRPKESTISSRPKQLR